MEFDMDQGNGAGFLEGWEEDLPEDGPPGPEEAPAGENGENRPSAGPGNGGPEDRGPGEALPGTPPDLPLRAPGGPRPPVLPGAPGGLGMPGMPGGGGLPGAFRDLGREIRVQADLRTFAAAFPEAARDPSAIPRGVWDMVRGGRTLTDAYAAYRAVREQAGAQNARSAARSAGTMRSAGSGAGPRDPFLEGWDD